VKWLDPRLVELWERALRSVQRTLEGRSARERWLLVGIGAIAATLLVQVAVVEPVKARTADAVAEAERLEQGLQRASRLAPEIRRLRQEISEVEKRIQPGAQTNLLQLLEQIAEAAQMRDRLESVKPKRASGNDQYPESRAEVQLRGATLPQLVQFLYRIQAADLYLLVRSLSIKSRNDDTQLLDVSFSVSSFQRG
jgi:type II secretory pathway component PulM